MLGLRRRVALAASIGLAAAMAAASVPAAAQTTLRMVSHADIKILDPIWTTALITRNQVDEAFGLGFISNDGDEGRCVDDHLGSPTSSYSRSL